MVEVSTPEQLVERLKKGKYKPADDIMLSSMYLNAILSYYRIVRDLLTFIRFRSETTVDGGRRYRLRPAEDVVKVPSTC